MIDVGNYRKLIAAHRQGNMLSPSEEFLCDLVEKLSQEVSDEFASLRPASPQHEEPK